MKEKQISTTLNVKFIMKHFSKISHERNEKRKFTFNNQIILLKKLN